MALTGIQYASGPLKEIQKALKSFNVGKIVSYGSKKAGQRLGLGSGLSIDGYVHPELRDSAKLLCGGVETMGMAVESLLMREGKAVINKQAALTRLADAAIETYGSSSSRSPPLPAAMTGVWPRQGCRRP